MSPAKMTLGVRLDEDQRKRMEDGARALGITPSEYARRLLGMATVFDPVVEDVLRRVGEQFKRNRTQVIEALLIANICRGMARNGERPNEPAELPEFSNDALGLPVLGQRLFNLLLPRYVEEERRHSEAEKRPRLDRGALYQAKRTLEAVAANLATFTTALKVVAEIQGGNPSPEVQQLVAILRDMNSQVAELRASAVTRAAEEQP